MYVYYKEFCIFWSDSATLEYLLCKQHIRPTGPKKKGKVGEKSTFKAETDIIGVVLFDGFCYFQLRYKAHADYQVRSLDVGEHHCCPSLCLIRNIFYSTISVIAVAGLPGIGMSMDSLGPLGWRVGPLLCSWFRCIPWTLRWEFQGHIRSLENVLCPSRHIWSVFVVFWTTLECWGRASAVGSGFGTQGWTLVWEGAVSK